jgi:hypothetical protein
MMFYVVAIVISLWFVLRIRVYLYVLSISKHYHVFPNMGVLENGWFIIYNGNSYRNG